MLYFFILKFLETELIISEADWAKIGIQLRPFKFQNKSYPDKFNWTSVINKLVMDKLKINCVLKFVFKNKTFFEASCVDSDCACVVNVRILSRQDSQPHKICSVELKNYSKNHNHKPSTRQLRGTARAEIREALLRESPLIVANKTAQKYAMLEQAVPNFEPTLTQLQKISSENNEKRKEILYNVFEAHHDRKKEHLFVCSFSLLPAVQVFYVEKSQVTFLQNFFVGYVYKVLNE